MSRRNSTTVLPIAQRLNPSPVGKSIVYDRETRDFACFLDAIYIGHAATYGDGESRLNAAAYESLADTQVETADMAADAAAYQMEAA
jgi:hypothetical protein